MQIRLTVRTGALTGRSIEVRTAAVVIGRSGSDLDLDDPGVSRRHASVTWAESGGAYIADLGSHNGTFINGVRITAATWLRPGDVLMLGATQIGVDGTAPEPAIARQPDGMTAVVSRPQPSPPIAAPWPSAAAVAPPAYVAPPAFAIPGSTRRATRAATRLAAATVASFGAVVMTAIALILYFALR